MEKIDLNSWKRKVHFEWFQKFANPCFGVTSRLDITNMFLRCKQAKKSIHAAMCYAVSKQLNSMDSFKYRVLNNEVYKIDCGNVAYTICLDDGNFMNSRVNFVDDVNLFCTTMKDDVEAKRKTSGMKTEFNTVSIIDDFYFSCLPWLDFLSCTHPIPTDCPENACIPRICWGKIVCENGRYFVSVNITASHSLVDGRDIAFAFNGIQDLFNNIDF